MMTARLLWACLFIIGACGLSTSASPQQNEPLMPYTYAMYCHQCHAQEPGVGPLGIMDMKDKDGNLMHPEYILGNVRFGFKAMPAFRNPEVSDQEMQEIVTYLKNLASYRAANPK